MRKLVLSLACLVVFLGQLWAGSLYVPGEIIIKPKPGKASALFAKSGLVVKKAFSDIGVYLVKLPEGVSVDEAIKQYKSNGYVEYAEPNYIVKKASVPNDPEFPKKWGLNLIDVVDVWDNCTGGNVIVAVVDTGVDYEHEDLKANIWNNTDEVPDNGIDDDNNNYVDDIRGYNFAYDNNDPMDDDVDTHGTHVSGIIGAVGNNSIGVVGVAWSVKIMPVKVLDSNGYGTLADVISGVKYAVDNGASIINMSLEMPGYSYSLEDVFKYADEKGVLVVCAAGNSNYNLDELDVSPASIKVPNKIAVASLNREGNLSSFSNYGIRTVEVVAPGGDYPQYSEEGILSTVSISSYKYGYMSGTSMAAPFVSGCAALLKACLGIDHYKIKARILNGVEKLGYNVISRGLLDVKKAFSVSDAPAIFMVTPYKIDPGDNFTIIGVNFGNTTGKLSFYLHNATFDISSWNDTVIKAQLKSADGNFTGELFVNDNGSGFYVTVGTISSDSDNNTYVVNSPPSVEVKASVYVGNKPLEVTFYANAQDKDGSIVAYRWYFEDENVVVTTCNATCSHTFFKEGTWRAGVTVYDDNKAASSDFVTITVLPEDSQETTNSPCFIATCVYGSQSWQVKILRRFRDKYLMKSEIGVRLVKLYYKYSPYLVNYVKDKSVLKAVIALYLYPVVILAFVLVAIPWYIKLLLFGVFGFGVYYRLIR